MSASTATLAPTEPVGRWVADRWVVALVVGTVLLRIPRLTAPLGSDEGGFLLVAGQWHAGGTSLYGDYWVDRPPLLIALFDLAGHAGGTVPLRVLGCLFAVAAVWLSHRLARCFGGSTRRALAAPAVTAALLGTPLFGSFEVNGELLATPFVLGGLLAAWSAYSRPGRRRDSMLRWAAAGAAGAAAVLVKQNFVDVFVFVALLLLTARLVQARTTRAVVEGGLAVLAGAGVVMVGVGLLAGARGTSVPGLWDALVVFRAQAGHLIARSASGATTRRLDRLPWILLVSGAAPLIALLLLKAARPPLQPVLVAAAGLLGWELAAIFAGGSYWLHYLVGIVPGVALGVALLAPGPDLLGALTRRAVLWTAVTGLVTGFGGLLTPPGQPASTAVGEWLARAAAPHDTATVLYGQPNVLEVAGLSSPYPELWSLPIRVRDPELSVLTAVLRGPQAPDWLLVHGSLAGWGLDPSRAEQALAVRYHRVAVVRGYQVFLLDGVSRALP